MKNVYVTAAAAVAGLLITASGNRPRNRMKLPSFPGIAEVRASIPGRLRLYMPAVITSHVGIQLDEVLVSVAISIIPFCVLLFMGWRINVISLGPEEAQSLGINYRANRFIIIACATLMTANCVSISGSVGWVGLVIPHIKSFRRR